MSPSLKFSRTAYSALEQSDIALLRIIYIFPNLNARAYDHRAVLANLTRQRLIDCAGAPDNPNTGAVQVSNKGLDFLKDFELDLLGYEGETSKTPMAVRVNTRAFNERLEAFDPHYESR